MEYNSMLAEFSQFLQEELGILPSELAVVLDRRQRASDPLPMLLWQYGLVSLDRLSAIFDWLDERDRASMVQPQNCPCDRQTRPGAIPSECPALPLFC